MPKVSRPRPSIKSLDTETSGIDLHHGAKPFFVTMCELDADPVFWEVDVDPFTREPQWTEDDLDEIEEEVANAEELVLQNSKFDVRALWTVRKRFGDGWDWKKTQDTLMAGHLLASNQPHDLTTMSLVYCGINIQPLEIRLKEAVNEARRFARSNRPEWVIAKSGNEDMPSVKGSASGCDYWLPRAVAKSEGYPIPDEDCDHKWRQDSGVPGKVCRRCSGHDWHILLRDYSNGDSVVTVKLFDVMRKRLHQEDLWEIYQERMKCLPVAFQMEQTGITVSGERLRKQTVDYGRESLAAGKKCVEIAERRGMELVLPKSGNNKSLLSFCFSQEELIECPVCTQAPPRKGPKQKCVNCGGIGEVKSWPKNNGLNLPPVVVTATGNPSLNKVALEEYLSTYDEQSEEYQFLSNLRDKRKRDTALSYMESYQRFWLPLGIFNKKGEQLWYRLHPSLNPTGTDTLRWSSSSPNEQNISKSEGFNLRYSFGPAPGRVWYSLDYSNLELVIPAYESGEAAMIELFEKPNEPPYFGSYHLLNASIVYPELFWPLAEKQGAFKKQYASTWYQWVKNMGFAIQYGCQEAKADATAHREGSYQKIKESMPKIAQLNDRMVAMANELGYVETIPDRTVNPRRGYPIYCSRSKWGKVSPTVPLNYHVQSTACWVMMKAMIKVSEYLKRFEDHRLVMMIHDEIVLDFPDVGKRNLPIVRKVAQLMRSCGDDIGIPLRTSMECHSVSWDKGVAV